MIYYLKPDKRLRLLISEFHIQRSLMLRTLLRDFSNTVSNISVNRKIVKAIQVAKLNGKSYPLFIKFYSLPKGGKQRQEK